MNKLKDIRAKWHTDLEIKLEESSFLLKNIYAMGINDQLMRQGINWKLNQEYQFYERLHNIFKVYELDGSEKSLIRVGRDNDGGYVMVNPFSIRKIAYSFGISDDVSWDAAMADHGYEVFMYDHTIERLPYERRQFHWEKKGIAGNSAGELMTLNQILERNGHSDETGMILKMDVEGAEWDVLNTVSCNTLEKFEQIVIELHGLNDTLNADTILRGLGKLCKTHYCVHIHGNNSGNISYCERFITPETIEATFVKRTSEKMLIEDMGIFPKTIDQPCVPWVSDVKIGKWNI